MFALPRGYDDVFADPPRTQEVNVGETKTRWTLRALRCSTLDDREPSPFKRP